MKYKCPICGYVYDENAEKVPFNELPSDWKCPWCGAPKSVFAPENAETEVKKVVKPVPEHKDVKLTYGQLAAICSNLARGCEKQYKTDEQALFGEIADYYTAIAGVPEKADLEELSRLLGEDLSENYPSVNQIAAEHGDRGTLRIKVWGEKVTNMAKTLVDQYLTEGEDFLRNSEIFVCTVCGFIYVGSDAPAICPVCKVPDWKFEKVVG